MNQQGFEEYTYFAYGRETGTAKSYITAIHILDRLFSIKDVFGLRGKSLTEVDDEFLLHQIAGFVVSEEKLFKSGKDSIFKYGLDTQKLQLIKLTLALREKLFIMHQILLEAVFSFRLQAAFTWQKVKFHLILLIHVLEEQSMLLLRM